jgi:hypothetical protein
MIIGARQTPLDSQDANPALQALHRGLLMMMALGISGATRADLPEFDAAAFDRNLSTGNLFNWIDFDNYDSQVSWPNGNEDVGANGWTSYVGERIAHDDNLYRLPSQAAVPNAARIASLDDNVNTVTAGLDTHFSSARQSLELLARADNNRFAHNRHLNNTSGSAHALWHWTFGSRLSGDVGVAYDRLLAGFGNYYVVTNNFGAKNIVSTSNFFAAAHVELGSDWVLSAGGRNASTSHSLNTFDKFSADSGTLAAEYHTASDTVVRLEHEHTKGHYPLPGFLNGTSFDRDFRQNISTFQFEYLLTGRLRVRANGGYIDHRYPYAAQHGFSGAIWDAGLACVPSAKTQVVVSALRQLHSYVDAQSQYFVSRGVRVTAAWAPTAKLSAEVQFSREDQHFIGPNPTVVSLIYPSHNLINSRQLDLAWSVSRPVQVVLSYRFLTRDSNVPVFLYDDTIVSANLRARF